MRNAVSVFTWIFCLVLSPISAETQEEIGNEPLAILEGLADLGDANAQFEMGINYSLGPSKALKHSISRLINDEDAFWMAHPMFWAPFVVVGEGASAVQ